MQIVINFFKDTFDVHKRLTRKAYFMPVILYSAIISFILGMILCYYTNRYLYIRFSDAMYLDEERFYRVAFITCMALFVLLIPAFSATIRRLNDLGFCENISIFIFVSFLVLNYIFSYLVGNLYFLLNTSIVFGIIMLFPTNFFEKYKHKFKKTS